MATSLYIINPATPWPTFFGGEAFAAQGLPATVMMADLATPTLAAFAPSDFDVRLCDEHLEPADLDAPADFVAITGKASQAARMVELAAEYRARGRKVIMGGPYATLSPERLRPHCDVLVRGEIEEIADPFFSDLRSGRWQEEYRADWPDLESCRVPRWDLYPTDRAVLGSLQTSRGCPFDCEFCDTTAYLGRHQRHKPLTLVMDELEALYRRGYRQAFVCDDNVTAHRQRAAELFSRMAHWNRRCADGPVDFASQGSLDAADDEELLTACRQAGISNLFVGIESPSSASLREAKKRQNLTASLPERLERLVAHGIDVIGGLIVGFDADGPETFDRQYELAMRTAIPIFTVNALSAPDQTPLQARLKEDGRLVGGYEMGMGWHTNVQPLRMSRDELVYGVRDLVGRLYHPAAFGERLLRMIETLGVPHDAPLPRRRQVRRAEAHGMRLLTRLRHSGPDEEQLLERVTRALSRRPEAWNATWRSLLIYAQMRHMHQATVGRAPRSDDHATVT